MTIKDKFEEMKEHHEGRKEYRHELREERKLEHELKHDVKEGIKEVGKFDKELGHELKKEAKADYKEYKNHCNNNVVHDHNVEWYGVCSGRNGIPGKGSRRKSRRDGNCSNRDAQWGRCRRI